MTSVRKYIFFLLFLSKILRKNLLLNTISWTHEFKLNVTIYTCWPRNRKYLQRIRISTTKIDTLKLYLDIAVYTYTYRWTSRHVYIAPLIANNWGLRFASTIIYKVEYILNDTYRCNVLNTLRAKEKLSSVHYDCGMPDAIQVSTYGEECRCKIIIRIIVGRWHLLYNKYLKAFETSFGPFLESGRKYTTRPHDWHCHRPLWLISVVTIGVFEIVVIIVHVTVKRNVFVLLFIKKKDVFFIFIYWCIPLVFRCPIEVRTKSNTAKYFCF